MAELISFVEANPLGFALLMLISPIVHELGHIIALYVCGQKLLAVRFSFKSLIPEVVIDLRTLPAIKLFIISSAGMVASLAWFWLLAPLLLEMPISAKIFTSHISLINIIPLSKKTSPPKKRIVLWQGRGVEGIIAELDAIAMNVAVTDGTYMLKSLRSSRWQQTQ